MTFDEPKLFEFSKLLERKNCNCLLDLEFRERTLCISNLEMQKSKQMQFKNLTTECSICFPWENDDATDCVKDLEYRSEMIIFESLLTTFKASFIFEAAAGQ